MNEISFDIDIRVRTRSILSLRGFKFRKGAITFLLGESGIGKTLAARALFGLLDPDEFTVTMNGLDYRTYLGRSNLASLQKDGFFVFQEPSSHLNPLLTVEQQLQEGDLARPADPVESLKELWWDEASREAEAIAGLYPRPYRPSGGEKQRVLLAMALRKMDIPREKRWGMGDGVFIFDEPTGSLDNPYRDRFVSLLMDRFRRHPRTILFITHDYSLLRHVLSAHSDMTGVMEFRELTSKYDRLFLREFRPSVYADWLRSLERTRSGHDSRSTPDAIFSLEGRLHVLGRELTITSDPQGDQPATLEIHPGRMVYLKAPSGTGKTSLAKAVMGLVRAGRMRAVVSGVQLTETTPRRSWHKLWGKKLTMVFQHADEALNMHSSVEETLAQLPVPGGASSEKIVQHLCELFDRESVGSLLRKKIWMLSGGQKQRLNLVRGLMLGTDVIFLDEPLNGLDYESAIRVVSVIQRKLSEGKGILVISHNEEIFNALVREKDQYYLHASQTGSWALPIDRRVD